MVSVELTILSVSDPDGGHAMPRWLKAYLLVTGILAFLAMAMPWLVIIGFIMLIIPGLVLMAMPTAFLVGCVFTAFYLFFKSKLSGVAAGLTAVVATPALLFAIPFPASQAGKADFERLTLPPVTPAGLIRVTGDVRMESGFARWDNANREKLGVRPFACDNRCVALLFEPGVTSVTMGSTAKLTFDQIRNGETVNAAETRTYRLKPRAQCGTAALIPDLEGRLGQFGKTMEDNRAFGLQWQQKLTDTYCLTGEKPISRHDFLLRTGDWHPDRQTDTDWSLSYRRASAPWGEIRNGKGQILFRMFNLSVSTLASPLHVSFFGSKNDTRFRWGRTALGKRGPDNWETPIKALDERLDVQRTINLDAAIATTRQSLMAALDNPALPADAPVFAAVDGYMALLEKQKSTPADFVLIQRLIAEPRLNELKGAWVLPKILNDDQLNQLTPAIIAKLSGLPDTVRPDTQGLGAVLKHWPEGTFASLSPATLALLNDVKKRRRATGLIRRLPDMGATAAPRLTTIIADHVAAIERFDRYDPSLTGVEKHHGLSAHRDARSAAVEALCVLGPAASGQRSALEAIEQRIKETGFSRRDWDRMMVRLGKPVDQINKPEDLSGSVDNYRKNIRYFLDRFDPKRSCS
jgi:hypothetical protein